MELKQIRVGAKCTFVPYFRYSTTDAENTRRKRDTVTGKIVYINREHRMFTVEYRLGKHGTVMHESFKLKGAKL